MRRIGAAAIFTFHLLLLLAVAAGISVAVWTVGLLPLGEYRALSVVVASLGLILVAGIAIYRGFMSVRPLGEGQIPEGSSQEFAYHVHLLFDLILFSPVLNSRILPVPLLRLMYQGLGARMGPNSYTAGLIADPIFVTIGHDTILGQDSIVAPHAIEGETLAHYQIRIGNRVTVGARSVILNGVTIGDGAIVATGAVVTKGTQIGPGEVWGGVPAKLIRPAETPPSEADAAGRALPPAGAREPDA